MQNRLKAIRKELGINQAEFADMLGVSESIIKSWETGRRSPSSSSIYMIADKFNVRREWLESGSEPMRFPEPNRNQELEIVAQLTKNLDDPVNQIVRSIMAVYINMDQAERASAKKFAQSLLNELRALDKFDAYTE